ncbi:MAG: lamin tail domain-containing protein [Demequinaceae bacterium]|nr:lamin tail domain-containing protein [Demequinaceae bacterium]
MEQDGLVTDGGATFRLETIQSGAAVCYIVRAPVGPVVDGAFGDWTPRMPVEDLEGDALSSATGETGAANSDISGARISSTSDQALFYMSVNGTMLAGCDIPAGMARWSHSEAPSGGSSNITRSMHGVDRAFVFIDTDQNQSTGYVVGGSEVSMVVLGKDGRVISARMYTYDGSDWIPGAAVDAAIDGYQLELGAGMAGLGLEAGSVYTVTFAAEDWRGYADDLMVYMPTQMPYGFREFGGVIINEVFNTSPPNPSSDWIELYNTGSEPVSREGWMLFVDENLIYTFPAVILQPGELYVAGNLEFLRGTRFVLTDAGPLTIIDSVTLPFWKIESYGRIGTADDEYASWDGMEPTPGVINTGQVPIPEFGEVLIPLAIVPIMLFAIRRAREPRTSSRDKRV